MNRIYWIKVLLLIASPLATAAQNKTLRKWERAFEALRLRNKQDVQKRLEIAPSHHKEEFSPYQGSYDYFEPTRLSKEKYESQEESQEAQHNDPHGFPYHSKEISQEHRELKNHVVHAHKGPHTDPNYSDEDYNSDHRKGPPKYSDSEKEEYHPHAASDEVDSKPHSGESPVYRKTSRYRPPHLYSGTPLVPHDFKAHSPYYHAPYRPRIYLPYRPSHRFKERTTLIVPSIHKPPYGSKIQNVHSKHYHDSDYYDYPAKTKYSSYAKLTKPEYASSSSYFVGNQRSKYPDYKPHYSSYSERFKGYGPSYDYPDSHSSFPIQHHTTPEDFERKPDPYYASEAYARDKAFGVNPLEKGISIPLNISSDRFSKPDPSVYPGDKYSHIPERKPDVFSPSYGPSGYPKERYSPRLSYSSSFDPNDARFKYPAHPFISSSSDTRDTYLKSGSNKEEQLPHDLAASQTFGTKGRTIKVSPEFDGTYYYYTYRTPQRNKDFSPSLRTNNTIKLNVSIKVSDPDAKLSQSSEDSTVLTLPSIRGKNGISSPECSLNENGTFCLHDSQYPYASVNNAINRHREKLQRLLLEIPVNETAKENLTGNSHNSPCQVKIRYSPLMRAANSEGKWKIIVRLPQNYDSHNYNQIVRLEQCYVPGSSCDSSNLNSTGKCLQKYVKRTLLSLSSETGLHLDTFYLPSACVCHSEENQNLRSNQKSRKWKQDQKKLKIG